VRLSISTQFPPCPIVDLPFIRLASLGIEILNVGDPPTLCPFRQSKPVDICWLEFTPDDPKKGIFLDIGKEDPDRFGNGRNTGFRRGQSDGKAGVYLA
jgi:hypothetical protein